MVLKNFLKLFFQKDLEVSKTCLTFAPAFDDKRTANGSQKKKFENFFKKIWKFEKVAVSLQPLSASKIGEKQNVIKQTSVLRYNSFFEVFEQLNKFFPHSQECNFKRNNYL